MSSVSFELPWPPSANHAWRPTVRGGKILSDEHKSYRRAVGDTVLEHRIPRHRWTTDRLAVGMLCHPPNARACDIDNRVKTALDALVWAGVLLDDRYIDLLVIARGEVLAPDGAMLVHIEELSSLSAPMRAALDNLLPARARGATTAPAVRQQHNAQ